MLVEPDQAAESGRLHVLVDAVLPLEEAGKALGETNRATGKIGLSLAG